MISVAFAAERHFVRPTRRSPDFLATQRLKDRSPVIRILVHAGILFSIAAFPVSRLSGQQRPYGELRVSRLPLYGGDVTVGSVATWAWTVSAGLRVGDLATGHLEAFYTLSPMDTDPHNNAPRIQLAGIMFGFSRPPEAEWSFVGSVGAGVIDIRPEPRGACDPPLCFDEGGAHFEEATLPTAVGRLGVHARLIPRLHTRLDARVHWPFGGPSEVGDSDNLRLEIGLGVLYFF
jgi:hypothetical protein